MPKLQSVEDLDALRAACLQARDPARPCLTVCAGSGCSASGAHDLLRALRRSLQQQGLQDAVDVRSTGCHGFCEKGPVVVILPQRVFYPNVQIADVPEIIDKTVVAGETIERLLYIDPTSGEKSSNDHEIPFYAKQQRSVFRLNGVLDPILHQLRSDAEDHA